MSQILLPFLSGPVDGSGHDPKGKVRRPIKPGIVGSAEFYDNDTRRLVLVRERGEGVGSVMFVGMNPSTATALVDDPTVVLEQEYAWRWGYRRYLKCNAMDYRATDQSTLVADGIVPCGPRNLEFILDTASRVDLVVLTYGAPHRSLDRYGRAVSDGLRAAGIPTMCLGVTAKGHPVHPLRKRSDLVPVPFPGYPS